MNSLDLPLKKPSTPSFFAPSTGFRTIPVTPSNTPWKKEKNNVTAVLTLVSLIINAPVSV